MTYFPLFTKRLFSSAALCNNSIHQIAASTTARESISIEGWVQRCQKKGTVNFIWINDGLSTKTIQVVVPKDVQHTVPVGAAVKILGKWQSSQGAQQSMEVLAKSMVIMGKDEDPRYSGLTPDNLRKKIHLRTKSTSFAALLRLRSHLTKVTHDFFMGKNFIHVDTPALTTNDCEGAGETFIVANRGSTENSFFGDKSIYLSVSGQLHLEAVISGAARAYTFSSAFRADKQQSRSHLTEFKMIEAEIAFTENLDFLLLLVTDYLKTCSSSLLSQERLEDFSALMNYSEKNHRTVLEKIAKMDDYPRLTYSEAVQILQSKNESVSSDGLNKKNEAFLVEYVNSPVFITNFPSAQKPFYMKRTSDNQYTESFDLLCPIVGELAGGSIREPFVDNLKFREGSIDWYEECRKRGKPVSGGFGIGFERLLQVLLGIYNIKDTIPFPRWYKHCQYGQAEGSISFSSTFKIAKPS